MLSASDCRAIAAVPAARARVMSVHSVRGGTGKSNLTASLAALLAAQGRRVAVIDGNVRSPGLHVLFGLGEDARCGRSLNDYLAGDCSLADAVHEVAVPAAAEAGGTLYVVPASSDPSHIERLLAHGGDPQALRDGMARLASELRLQAIVIDTHHGGAPESVLALGLCDATAIVLRPDYQDYEATGAAIALARRVGVQRTVLVVNQVPPAFDVVKVRDSVQRTFGCPVAAVLPYSESVMAFSSGGVFALRHPAHPFTALCERVVATLMED